MTEVDCLIEANATEAKRIMTEIEIINAGMTVTRPSPMVRTV